MKTKIKCSRCRNPKEIELKNPIFLKDETTEYCPNCKTDLAYVQADWLFPKYNSWLIRTNTAVII